MKFLGQDERPKNYEQREYGIVDCVDAEGSRGETKTCGVDAYRKTDRDVDLIKEIVGARPEVGILPASHKVMDAARLEYSFDNRVEKLEHNLQDDKERDRA